ncbi:MAG TPA: Dyp-type peroxidase [Nitrososphaeraceae archaeon]
MAERKYRENEEKRLFSERRKQPGVGFPSARKQDHLLIVRLNLEPSATKDIARVRIGLRVLCNLFERIYKGRVKIDELLEDGRVELWPLSRFDFSATIGFGIGFFEKLRLKQENRPKNLYEMPNHIGLLDPIQYKLFQTDMIIQLGSSKDIVNRWVFDSDIYPIEADDNKAYQESKYDNFFSAKYRNNRRVGTKSVHDIVTAIKDWAIVTDVHSGFQRIDGRNLMGFYDGTSNVDRLINDVVWTTKEDEGDKLKDGTYMVFNKIEHDLEQWRRLSDREKERWVGRSKGTGLLLGTLTKDQDDKLASDSRSEDPLIRRTALAKLRNLLDDQNEPEQRVFDSNDPRFKNIKFECPIWSHVRKANPRGEGGVEIVRIFRRGYLFMESSPDGKVSSGLLFICFQKNISKGFERIKKKFLNNKDFPVPEVRKSFTREESTERRRHARFSKDELRRMGPNEKYAFGLDSEEAYRQAIEESQYKDSQNTGREGLCGPSKLGIIPNGEFLATVTLGGGYYFIPPIPNKNITELAEQFFD